MTATLIEARSLLMHDYTRPRCAPKYGQAPDLSSRSLRISALLPGRLTTMIDVSFQDSDFQSALETGIGAATGRRRMPRRCRATAQRIKDGDSDSWLDNGPRPPARSGPPPSRRRANRRVTALAHFRRAATYYAAALHRVLHSSEPDRQLGIWRRQRFCWERVVDLSPVPGQRIEIPYEDTTLPAFFFPAPDADAGERRPVIVLNSGSHEVTSYMLAYAGAAAGERGYHWMTSTAPASRPRSTSKGSRPAPTGKRFSRPS